MFTPIDRTKGSPFKMKKDESSRAQELARYEIAYDVPEEHFDQLAKLVTQLVQAPIGGISLVNSHIVWLKARVGVELSCLERAGAFCAHAVDSNQDFFMVKNTLVDPRFSQNFLVTQHGICFYAAAPLINKGYCLGTLWVMDLKPRTSMEPHNILLMKEMAAQACRLLDNYYQNQLTGFPNLSLFKQNFQAIINRKICKQLEDLQLSKSSLNNGVRIDKKSEASQYAIGYLKINDIRKMNRLFSRLATEDLIMSFSLILREWLGVNNPYAQISFSSFCFAIELTEYSALEFIINNLNQLLLQQFPIANTRSHIVAKVGFSLFPDHGTNVPALLEKAENSALNINHENESTIRIYDSSVDDDIRILADLHYDIELSSIYDQNILPYFQPQVNFLTGELIGFEALARWRHQEFGLIPADRFIPLAEKNGLIRKLDLKIFAGTCQAIRTWLDAGLKVVTVSTNFSRITLLHPGVIDEIEKILLENDIPRTTIEIEITENGLIEDTQVLTQLDKKLRQLGVRVAIDDFGTGMSNLSSLQSFKFDRIKIDRQFIKDISNDSRIKGIFEFIKGISEVFDVDLICEGIDNVADLKVLKQAGVGCVQGWLFSAALPKEKIPAILAMFNTSERVREQLINNPLLIADLFVGNELP